MINSIDLQSLLLGIWMGGVLVAGYMTLAFARPLNVKTAALMLGSVGLWPLTGLVFLLAHIINSVLDTSATDA